MLDPLPSGHPLPCPPCWQAKVDAEVDLHRARHKELWGIHMTYCFRYCSPHTSPVGPQQGGGAGPGDGGSEGGESCMEQWSQVVARQ